MTAEDIKRMLSMRYDSGRLWFFLTEVKDGPTWFRSSHRRLDVWVMKKTWTKYDATGYEIKVSRSDFLADKKWRDYLPFCTRFYFACPRDLIKPEELDDGIGLIYCYPSGGTRTVRKARFTPREADAAFLLYILMHRVKSIWPEDYEPSPDDLNEKPFVPQQLEMEPTQELSQ